jgi:hypothetical protein
MIRKFLNRCGESGWRLVVDCGRGGRACRVADNGGGVGAREGGLVIAQFRRKQILRFDRSERPQCVEVAVIKFQFFKTP